MKKLITIVLLATAGTAHAGGWEHLNNNVESCKSYAALGDLYYRMAQQGKRPTRRYPPYAEPMRQHIEDEIYGHTDAYDQTSARTWAASYCLDHVDAVIHEGQRTGQLPQSD
ncbi:MAG: hypothetical protein M3O74_13730 [Pseudomonadota bacterium]|nr:hypothetical protein [Pseudomonadota bacterium]